MADDRIAEFHAAVNDRFGFLFERGFVVTDAQSLGDRYGSVAFHSPTVDIEIGWDAYDGCLDVDMNGKNVWYMLREAGVWNLPGYAGYALDSMKHGLDRIADFLKARLTN